MWILEIAKKQTNPKTVPLSFSSFSFFNNHSLQNKEGHLQQMEKWPMWCCMKHAFRQCGFPICSFVASSYNREEGQHSLSLGNWTRVHAACTWAILGNSDGEGYIAPILFWASLKHLSGHCWKETAGLDGTLIYSSYIPLNGLWGSLQPWKRHQHKSNMLDMWLSCPLLHCWFIRISIAYSDRQQLSGSSGDSRSFLAPSTPNL